MSDEVPGGVRTRRSGVRSTVYLPRETHARLKTAGVTMGTAITQWLDALQAIADAGYPLDPDRPDVAEAVEGFLQNGWAV